MATQETHIYSSQLLCMLSEYFIEFEAGKMCPNAVLLTQRAYQSLKEVYPDMINNKKLLYNGMSLDIIITQEETVGMSITYSNKIT